jgi:hypothetical protein
MPSENSTDRGKASSERSNGGFAFIEVNHGDNKTKKTKRLAQARSHITTNYYKNLRQKKVESEETARIRPRTLHPKLAIRETADENATQEYSHKTDEPLNQQELQLVHTTLELISQPKIDRLDPFDTLPIKADVKVDRTLQFCKC